MMGRWAFAALACLAIVAGCAGGASVPPAGTSANAVAARSGTRGPRASFVWAREIRDNLPLDGRARASDTMSIEVAVRMQNLPGLLRYATQVSTPGSPYYRQFLTPAQIAKRFGVTVPNYTMVQSYFAGFGMQVTAYPQRTFLRVTGSVAQMERAFGTPFARFRDGDTVALGPQGEPHFGVPLPVTSIVGLVTLAPATSVEPIRGTVTNFRGYAPQQVARGFDYSGPYAVGYAGNGIVTGVIGTGPRSAQDAALYQQTYGYSIAPIKQVSDTSPVPAPTGTLSGEAAIDSEIVAALAPRAREQFYVVGSSWGDTDGEIDLAIANDVADTISDSTGEPEPTAVQDAEANAMGTGQSQVRFAELAIEGIAFFASSGDNGSTTFACTFAYVLPNCVTYPASDPNAVAVGGVDIPLDSAGNLIGEITAWSTEQTHGGPITNGCNCVGSGGGLSIVATAPPWQRTAVGYTARAVPDIALDSALESGTGIVLDGAPGLGDGTSNAAPMANAMWALVLQACKASPKCATAGGPKKYRLGNPAPLLYAIYHGRDAGGLRYKDVFYDVLYGNNTPVLPSPLPTGLPTAAPSVNPSPIPSPSGYSAGPGYDLVTGLGVPFGGRLIDAIVPGAGAP